MLAIQRHEWIMRKLALERTLRVSDLSAALGVTEKTVREDLEKLEVKGLLRRIHGGAMLPEVEEAAQLPPVPNLRYPSEKMRIARRVVEEQIREEDIIALDGGSTTLEIARALPNASLTVVTNDLFIIAELAHKEHIRLVVPGGYRERNLLVGQEAAAFVRSINIHKSFMSATGIHLDDGLTVFTGVQLPMKRALVETAGRVFCVADRSKFGRSSLVTFAALEEMEAIYTDASLPEDLLATYRERGVRVECGDLE